MKIGRVKGTVTATIKDQQLVGFKLLVADIVNASGEVLEADIVASDNCGAGAGDHVLITTGSAARLPSNVAGIPVDMTIIAIIDHLDISQN